MIIFTIGSEQFVLPSLKDAEQMLGILEASTPVTSAYDADFNTYYVPNKRKSCGCEINSAGLISPEEHLVIQQKAAEKKAASKKTESVPA